MVRLSSLSRPQSRWLTLLSVIAALAILLTPAPSRAAVAEDSPAGMAATWIARDYQSPDSQIKLFGTGIMIDSLVSLAATGTESGVAVDMLADLRKLVGDYVGTGATFNPGSAGKVLHVLAVYGEDVTDFVGSDVEAELRASMVTSGDEAGRFGTAFTIQQATAVLGLAMTEDGVPADAVTYLASLQCESGEFTWDGTCPGAVDADTTGIVAVALIAGGDATTAGVSVEYLKSVQEADGSIPGWGTPNTNSTAAAAQAFIAAGDSAAADAAEEYLVSMQFPASAGADAGGLKWISSDIAANTFASVQGVWGLGVPALHEIVAPTYEFGDTAGTVFGAEIEWIAASGITLGCNPPANDSFCPEEPVTRGQMAAFLNRALELPAGSGSSFTDTSASLFAADIEAIAAVGITKGCNPPVNDQYCPERVVTRGEMAAFLSRAFGLVPGTGSGFTDTTGNVFAGDIEAIAAAGVTSGCNPPANDMFCPNSPVTREQMAAFIYRATHR